MLLPPFSAFIEQFDLTKFSYDLKEFAPQDLKKQSSLFSQEQYQFLCETASAMSIALLQQYHQWLAEQIP